MRLSDRKIIVTGTASGIGLAIAELFLREGASVLAIDRNAEAMERARSGLAGLGRGKLHCAAADVTQPEQIKRALDDGVAVLGGLDGVVNSAGLDMLRPFADMSVEEWNRVIAVNMTGPALVCHAALPFLRNVGRGTIVNIASGAGLRPLENRTAYCASKAGLIMFTKTLALELAAYEIRANVICPGVIDTPMFRASYEEAADPRAELARIMDRFAIKRPGKPMDIAYAALYLIGDESAHVTGSALAVDGGRAFH